MPDTGEFEEDDSSAGHNFIASSQDVNGPIIKNIELGPVNGEGPVDLHDVEQCKNQGQPQSPQFYAEEQADVIDDSANTDAEYTTQKFLQQFLVGIHGCNAESNRESPTTHIKAYGLDNHHGLEQLVPRNIPQWKMLLELLSKEGNEWLGQNEETVTWEVRRVGD